MPKTALSNEKESNAFFKAHKAELRILIQHRGTIDAMEVYLVEHPWLVSKFTADWLTIKSLNYAISGRVVFSIYCSHLSLFTGQ
jgi:hypothetical protein